MENAAGTGRVSFATLRSAEQGPPPKGGAEFGRRVVWIGRKRGAGGSGKKALLETTLSPAQSLP